MPDNVLLCSFDVKSLFTNVPVEETIKICSTALFKHGLNNTKLCKGDFEELMELATCNVEFSFNDTIYQQVDGVAMGSPLGPTMANIFVGFYEEKLFQDHGRPMLYARYVDDTFVVCRDAQERDEFYKHLNSLHQSLKFTMELEEDGCLPFLDVLVQKNKSVGGFCTTVYRKPSFTGEYTKWSSFCDVGRKISLVKSLTHRALMICSPQNLPAELEKLKSIFRMNGYPDRLVLKTIEEKVKAFNCLTPSKAGPAKCPVYIRIPYIGTISRMYKQKISDAVRKCYFAVNPRVIVTSKPILPSSVKDVLPATKRSQLIYLFSCCCDRKYVGRTLRRLKTRIDEHVPPKVLEVLGMDKTKQGDINPKSSIARHLMANVKCGKQYDESMFTVIGYARSEFHLKVLEALHINSKTPVLCKQKENVYSLLLFGCRNTL